MSYRQKQKEDYAIYVFLTTQIAKLCALLTYSIFGSIKFILIHLILKRKIEKLSVHLKQSYKFASFSRGLGDYFLIIS